MDDTTDTTPRHADADGHTHSGDHTDADGHTHTDRVAVEERVGANDPEPLTPRETERIRERLDDEPSRGGSRLGWFLTGFTVALLSLLVAGIVFLVVSDSDDDGTIELDVPSVDVGG